MRAVQAGRHGGPEVLEVVDLADPVPAPGQVLVATSWAGVNFADVYARQGIGLYAAATPFVPGGEGAGRIVTVGRDVDGLRVGDGVVWKQAPGSYAELVLVDASEAVPIPASLPEDVAAAVFLQGLTAHYLSTSTYPVRAGDTVVVHAAAGGVGLLLTQMVKLRGGRVIALVSSPAKVAVAEEAGADVALTYSEDFVPRVLALTEGRGVDAVYDGVGRATFEASLACLRKRGLMALYGAASGPVPPFDLQRLNSGGSLFITRPTLAHHTLTREELVWRSTDIFGWIADARLSVHIGGRYAFSEAARAHVDIASRGTVGKLLLRTH